MLADLSNFKHDYFIIDNKIAYKEQDGYSFDVVYGYKTMFAYYQEYENNNITRDSLINNISIGLNCG